MNLKVIALVALAIPGLTHEAFHAAVDPRSPLNFFAPLFMWLYPAFEDEGFLLAHIAVNATVMLFIILAIIWVARK